MTAFTIWAKRYNVADSGGHAEVFGGSGMAASAADDGAAFSSTSLNYIVGTQNTGSYNVYTEQFYGFDVSSLSGQTISATSVTLNTGANGSGLTGLTLQTRAATFPSSFVSPYAWYSYTQLASAALYAQSSTTLAVNSTVSLTGTSAFNTAISSGGTLKMVLVTNNQVAFNTENAYIYVKTAYAGTAQTTEPRITGTATGGGGTTQTATATGVTNSPAVVSGATRTAVATATAVSNSPTVAASAAAIQSGSASTTTSPTPAASAVVVRAVDAAVTTSPTSTASGTVTQSASASVTVSPTSDATATQSTAAKNADAALTTSPTTAATGVRAVTATTTNVTVSPTTSAAAVRVVLADLSTTVTPSTSGQIAATHNAVAAYALTPLTAAVATVTRTVSASGVTVTIITAAVADIGARRGSMSAATKATSTMSATTRTSATMTGA